MRYLHYIIINIVISIILCTSSIAHDQRDKDNDGSRRVYNHEKSYYEYVPSDKIDGYRDCRKVVEVRYNNKIKYHYYNVHKCNACWKHNRDNSYYKHYGRGVYSSPWRIGGHR